MALNEHQKIRIEALWLADSSKTEIANKLGVTYNTVKRHVNNLQKKNANKNAKKSINAKNERLVQTIREEVIEIKEKQNKKLLDTIINDDRMTKAADLILGILCDEDTLRNELNKGGIRGLTGLLGMITDKAVKYADLDIKRKHAKDGFNVVIDNNIGKIIDLMGEANTLSINPQDEIKEFKKEKTND